MSDEKEGVGWMEFGDERGDDDGVQVVVLTKWEEALGPLTC